MTCPGHRHIQAGGGFVGDQQRWFQGDRQGNGQALSHPTAELMGVGAEAVGPNAHPLQQFVGPVPGEPRRWFEAGGP
jgi:hypothetical protein